MKSPGVLASSRFRGSEVLPDLPGKTFLEQDAKSKLFYYFPSLTGSGAISNGNDGLEDRSPGSRTATVVNSPSVRNITVNSITVPTLEAVGTNAISIGDNGAGLFDEDFELFYVFQIEDGIPPGNHEFIGAVSTAGTTNFNFLITTTGKLLVRYRTPSADSRWDSTGAVLPDGVNGVHILRIKYDFTNDVFGIWLDETPIPGSFISGNMASLNPSTWAMNRDIYIGNFNDGSPSSNPVTNSIIAVAVTDILTDQEAADITEALTTFGVFTPSVKPTIQASALTAVSGQTSMLLSWTGGNGTNKLVVGRQGSAVNAQPTDGVSYTANTVFGSGSQIGSGNYVVYAGTSNTVTVTGLTRDTLYYFDVYEFNASGFRYLTTIGTNTTPNGVRTHYINDQDFANYATDYTENQVAGFTSDVVDGELVLSGNPKGYQDWVQHNEWIESLEEFDIEILVRLDGTLTADTAGIGLGIKNDLDNEDNRGVFGYFNTQLGSNEFGTVSIYSGTGSVSPTAFTWRGTSSSALVPTQGNTYKIQFSRTRAGNDAIYSVKVTDMSTVDNPFITQGWTETGSPSSAFYGTTTRAYIYQNGGTHAIDYFSVTRTGDDGGVVEPPITDFDIYVTITGNDTTGDGSIGNPYRTNSRGLQAIAALGGAVGSKKMSTGPGVYVETSFLSPPPNLGLWQGAGEGVTELTGSAALHYDISSGGRSSQTGFFINLTGSSSTTIDMTIKGMTLTGGSSSVINSNNAMKGAIAVRNRHGLKLENITFKHFNTCALRVGDTNELSVKNCTFLETGGKVGTSFGYYPVELWNVGGGTALGNADGNFKIVFDGCTFEDLRSNGAQLFGFTGGPGSNQLPEGNLKYITNLEIKNSTFNLDYTSDDNEGHRFCIEGLYFTLGNIWIHDNFFNSNLSFGCAGLTGGNEAARGKTRISHNTFALDPGAHSFVIEMQISNIEIDNNFVSGVLGAHNGCFVILNQQETFGNAGHAPVTRTDHGNWNIHHNIIECAHNSYADGIAGAAKWDIKGLIFEHNTIIFKTTSGTFWYGIIISGISGHQMTGLSLRSNAFIGQPHSSSILLDPSGGLTGAIVSHNFSSHLTINSSRTGATFSNNQGSIGGNLGIPLSGTKPTTRDQAFNGNYYRPSSVSILKGAGHDGTDVGALAAL